MAYQFTEEKKRPPPITLPLPPPPRPLPTIDQQRQQGQRSTDNTPLTSPIESHTPASGSGRSRTAMATFTNLIDQARSPRKSDHGSWISSNAGSTARSRQSGRSQHEALAAQAQIEALDEETARGKVESRAEKNLFKMTGQVPPTPMIGESMLLCMHSRAKIYRFGKRGRHLYQNRRLATTVPDRQRRATARTRGAAQKPKEKAFPEPP